MKHNSRQRPPSRWTREGGRGDEQCSGTRGLHTTNAQDTTVSSLLFVKVIARKVGRLTERPLLQPSKVHPLHPPRQTPLPPVPHLPVSPRELGIALLDLLNPLVLFVKLSVGEEDVLVGAGVGWRKRAEGGGQSSSRLRVELRERWREAHQR